MPVTTAKATKSKPGSCDSEAPMTRIAVTLAAVLVMTGWMAGKAQTTDPDFEIVVERR